MKFLLFGIIQGLTEFLPISSSGHLYLYKRLVGIEENLLPFFVFLHIATLLAVLTFLSKEIKLLFKKRLLLHILFITAITGIFGLGVKFYLVQFFENKFLVALCLFINAGILLSVRGNWKKSTLKEPVRRTIESIKLKDAIFIGILQGFSVFPGISRAGITICGLLKRGIKEEEAFKLSFLMAIPVILGAFVVESKGVLIGNFPLPSIILGFVFAFLSGLFALSVLKKSLIMGKLKYFGYYCLAASILSLRL